MPCVDLRSEVKTGYIRPFAPAVLRGKEIRKFAAEKCQSGRSGLTRNQVYLHGYRGFESLLFRTAHRPHTEAHRTGPAGPVFLRPTVPPGPARAARKGRKKPAACAACGGKVRFGAPASPARMRLPLRERERACGTRPASNPFSAPRTGPTPKRTEPAQQGRFFLRPNAPPGPARAARKGRKKPAACAACGGKVR